MNDRQRHLIAAAARDGGQPDWCRIEARAGDPKVADIYLFDEIGVWGTTAKDFVQQVKNLRAEQITLHINSPGGDVFDGIAILNTLRGHPATITTVVEGLAASAASVVAMAGDEIVMARNSEMMIHDASGFAIGNAADMASLADTLNRISDNIASVYAERAGGDIGYWRDVMLAETWYSAQETVDAGLADRVAEPAEKDPQAAEQAKARFDLAVFAYAGRAKAPAPAGPPAPPPEPPPVPAVVHPLEGAGMDPAKIREALDLPADASDEDVTSALTSAGLAAKTAEPGDEQHPDGGKPDDKPKAVRKDGTMVVDTSAWDERELRLQKLEAAQARAIRDERDQIIDKAVRDGKFAPARKPHWARLWDADPDGTREVIGSLARNVMPVESLGGSFEMSEDAEFDAEYAHLFPPTAKRG